MNYSLFEAISTVIALLFTGIQLLLLVLEMRRGNTWNSQNAAFEYCSHYSELIESIDMNSIDVFLRKISESSTENPFDPNCPEYRNTIKEIIIILQYFERLSVGLVCGYFNEEVVRRVMNYTFVTTYDKFEKYIRFRREHTGALLMSHFTRVADAWKFIPITYPYRTVPSIRRKIMLDRVKNVCSQSLDFGVIITRLMIRLVSKKMSDFS